MTTQVYIFDDVFDRATIESVAKQVCASVKVNGSCGDRQIDQTNVKVFLHKKNLDTKAAVIIKEFMASGFCYEGFFVDRLIFMHGNKNVVKYPMMVNVKTKTGSFICTTYSTNNVLDDISKVINGYNKYYATSHSLDTVVAETESLPFLNLLDIL